MLGDKIRRIRQERNETMDDFSQHFNPPASKGGVSNWENGYNNPNKKRLEKIAELGGMSVRELTKDTRKFKTIGKAIKHTRDKNRMTQEVFAKNVGLSRSYLNDLEHDRKNISVKTLQRLNEKLNISIEVKKDHFIVWEEK